MRHTIDGTGEDGYVAMMERKKMRDEEAKLAGLQDASDTQNDYDAIDRVSAEMYQIAADHGFHEGEAVGEEPSVERIGLFAANLHGEVSEFWEAARRGKLGEQCDKGVMLTNAEEELADIVIRAMDTAHTMGISLGAAIYTKSAYNRERKYKHGKKC